MNMQGADVSQYICAMIFGLVIGTAIGAVILRAAVSIYNKLAGGDNTNPHALVPEPSWGKAMGILFVATLCNYAINAVLEKILGLNNNPGEPSPMLFVAAIISMSINMAIIIFSLHKMLPTSLDRATLVTLCYISIAMAVVIILVTVIFAVVILVSIVAVNESTPI